MPATPKAKRALSVGSFRYVGFSAPVRKGVEKRGGGGVRGV